METGLLYQKYLESGKVSTDTRQITPGSVFFALKGPSFDANQFAKEALERGASYAVVDDPRVVLNERFLLVPNSLKALQDLAHHHRDQLKIPVIALTGSNGKTTSKELLNAVLSCKYRTHATQGNLNNHIGVPLTLLSIDRNTEISVIEMGANHLGEIAALCRIANPTHGFITNIGKAHIGTFGGFENIIRGKSELYQHLISMGGTVFINSSNPILANMAKRFRHPVFYPGKEDYYHCELVSAEPFVVVKAEDGAEIRTHLVGAYNFENIASALCIGKFFGVDSRAAQSAIAAYQPGNMRSQVLIKGTNTIILDAYNANPSSMEAAIRNLMSMHGNNKVVILGDMFELEDEAAEEHRRIGALLKGSGIKAFLFGELMSNAKSTFPEGKFFGNKNDLKVALESSPLRDALILIKGSRGMKMEEVVGWIG